MCAAACYAHRPRRRSLSLSFSSALSAFSGQHSRIGIHRNTAAVLIAFYSIRQPFGRRAPSLTTPPYAYSQHKIQHNRENGFWAMPDQFVTLAFQYIREFQTVRLTSVLDGPFDRRNFTNFFNKFVSSCLSNVLYCRKLYTRAQIHTPSHTHSLCSFIRGVLISTEQFLFTKG